MQARNAWRHLDGAANAHWLRPAPNHRTVTDFTTTRAITKVVAIVRSHDTAHNCKHYYAKGTTRRNTCCKFLYPTEPTNVRARLKSQAAAEWGLGTKYRDMKARRAPRGLGGFLEVAGGGKPHQRAPHPHGHRPPSDGIHSHHARVVARPRAPGPRQPCTASKITWGWRWMEKGDPAEALSAHNRCSEMHRQSQPTHR